MTRKTEAEGRNQKDDRVCLPTSDFRLGVLVRLLPSAICLAAAALLVAACGFQLRGTTTLPFTSIYVEAPTTSQLAVQLKRAVVLNSGTRVAERKEDAEVILQIINEQQEKQILSLTGGGRVSEFQVRYRVFFRLTDGKNREHIPASEIQLRREYTYSDSQVLATESEEALLYRDMRNDAVSQLLRRMQAAKLKT